MPDATQRRETDRLENTYRFMNVVGIVGSIFGVAVFAYAEAWPYAVALLLPLGMFIKAWTGDYGLQ